MTAKAHPYRPHPWHGLEVGPDPPREVYAYVEITSFDLIKYEIDKLTGYLRVDRPQRTSALPPAPYGFVPRTYCADRVAALCPGAERGDGDPLDISVISERPFNRSEIVLVARVVGGIQMIDGGEADDKIVAVLANDEVWKDVEEMDQLPDPIVERLHHYFATYKERRGEESRVSIERTYGAEHARRVVEASMADYRDHYGDALRPERET